MSVGRSMALQAAVGARQSGLVEVLQRECGLVEKELDQIEDAFRSTLHVRGGRVVCGRGGGWIEPLSIVVLMCMMCSRAVLPCEGTTCLALASPSPARYLDTTQYTHTCLM